ncbi:MAG: UDP-glucose/GDP-mannose dehydrogenase family protein [Myxococcales bacterium]|nr:UDP-glucose/GDP-mannose dehydrogenase family protein [Myxococcales bacterium]MCB9641930.1 UDP-glucose/GDP-mannose dehydrogenase family protein [Myxococcales bacterium]
MKLCVIGTGYVGLVAGACFAESGRHVVCVDINEQKIENLRKGIMPIYEPGLDEVVIRNHHKGNLTFSTDLAASVAGVDVCFIAVGTPPADDGSADLSQVFAVGESILKAATGPLVLVVKSTVPVGTQDQLRERCEQFAQHPVDWVSNPEFLREGLALKDFLEPDRVVIGANSQRGAEMMLDLYRPFVEDASQILTMAPRDAELCKYACNAMLATRISFMNDLANLCERVGANVESIRRGMGTDHRIGPHFLFSGIGYGGSCFPKDTQALLHVARQYDYELRIVQAVEDVNADQKAVPFFKLQRLLGDLKQKKIALWGLAFKPETDDMREAPSIVLIQRLIEAGARVSAYDPVAEETATAVFGDAIRSGALRLCEDEYQALEQADALVLATEWLAFRDPDFEQIRRLMRQPILIDGRNVYNAEKVKALGFTYEGVGRR